MASSTFFPDNVIYQFASTAPAPSKDFAQVLVTFRKVIYRLWHIMPPLRCDANKPPYEWKGTYEEFHEDDRLHSELERVFGPEMLTYIRELLLGNIDYIMHLPVKILYDICLLLNLEDLHNLSRVCKMFKYICNSEELWEMVFRKHSKSEVTTAIENLAKSEGWKKLFFTNKLQLQMSLKRFQELQAMSTDVGQDRK